MKILNAMSKTSIIDPVSKRLLTKIILKEFSNSETTLERSKELIALAYQFNISQLEEMMSQFNFENELNNILWKA